MSGVGWTADGDLTLPSAARMFDYLLGDAHNLAMDRQLACALEEAVPDIRRVVRMSRTFLRRAVIFLVENGIRQFLDVGSSIPTTGNAREIARLADPGCRVVQVERDPMTLAHNRFGLANDENSATVCADFRAVDEIFAADATRRTLDLSQPVGLLMVDVLHFVPDSEDPPVILAGYRQLLPPGSCLVATHLTGDQRPAETAAEVEVMRRSRDPIFPRGRAEIVKMFAGFELIEPGVVDVATWYPEREFGPAEKRAATALYAGIGRKS